MKHLPHVLARAVDGNKKLTFRPSFQRIFLFLGAIIGGLCAIPLLALLLGKCFLGVLALSVISALYVLFFTVFCQNLMRVDVTRETIAASDYWGIRRTLTWAEIERVQPASMCGFPYLKVESFRSNRSAIYVPLYFADQEAFRARTIEIASPVNPLRIALEKGAAVVVRAKAQG